MNKSKLLFEENNLMLMRQNSCFYLETTQLLHERILISYPQLTHQEFNQIHQNLVDCLTALISMFKVIPLTIKQIGVESVVQDKRETFYFQLIHIENKVIYHSIRERKYNVEFDFNVAI